MPTSGCTSTSSVVGAQARDRRLAARAQRGEVLAARGDAAREIVGERGGVVDEALEALRVEAR